MYIIEKFKPLLKLLSLRPHFWEGFHFYLNITHKMKFSTIEFTSDRDQSCSFLRIGHIYRRNFWWKTLFFVKCIIRYKYLFKLGIAHKNYFDFLDALHLKLLEIKQFHVILRRLDTYTKFSAVQLDTFDKLSAKSDGDFFFQTCAHKKYQSFRKSFQFFLIW